MLVIDLNPTRFRRGSDSDEENDDTLPLDEARAICVSLLSSTLGNAGDESSSEKDTLIEEERPKSRPSNITLPAGSERAAASPVAKEGSYGATLFDSARPPANSPNELPTITTWRGSGFVCTRALQVRAFYCFMGGGVPDCGVRHDTGQGEEARLDHAGHKNVESNRTMFCSCSCHKNSFVRELSKHPDFVILQAYKHEIPVYKHTRCVRGMGFRDENG